MTAPFPSLTEQGRIATHGMFDTEILTAMEEHADDEPTCEHPKGCDGVAVARLLIRCVCNKSRAGCRPHIDVTVKFLTEHDHHRCRTCGVRDASWSVVPL